VVDDFNTLWNRLLLRAPAVGPGLAQDLVRDAFNQLAERRQWSWLIRSGAFYPSIFYQTGTVAVTANDNTVTGSGTVWTQSFVGAQFRGGAPPSSFPTYTITQVLSNISLLLDKPWAGPTSSGLGYQIFQCYFPVPGDFQYFYSIVNPTSNYRLWHNLTQAEIDLADPQRVQTGLTFAAAFYDYSSTYSGSISPTLQVHGTGAAPVSTTATGFSFPQDSVYVVEITTGGASGTAVFTWKQDSGAANPGILTSTTPIDLSNGVQVYFPVGTYVVGDVFIIQCKAQTVSGVPRYELWPRPINTPYVYPFTYAAKLPALTPDQPQLPEFIARRGDVILEMALANCARFPGTDTMRNAYYDLNLAVQHEVRAEKMVYELEKKDDDTATKDLTYQELDYMPMPFLDGSFLQTHAIYPTP
jgi:hypothetical protein